MPISPRPDGGYIHRSELPLDVFAPVNLQSARKLLAAFSLLPTEYRLMPLLARCRHVEPSEEIFIGIDPKDSTRAIRISSRGLESLESLTNQAPADLLFEMEGDVCGRIEQVVAKYDFLGEESLNNDLQCKIALHVRSGTTQNCLQAPLYPTSAHLEYTFVNSVHDSASHSATLGLRDELSKLGTWFSRSLDDSECPEPANASGIGEIFHRWSYEEPKLMEQDERTSPVLYAANRQLDFVERLWHYCCGEAEQRVPSIIRALRLELEAGGLQAMINKNNRTALSSVIRECLRLSHKQLFKDRDETVAVVKESLDSLEKSPFEYLVEAGIYKLRRDYSTILICSGVSTWENLEFFNDYQISLSDQIKKLALLHDVTEAFCTLSQSVLGLPTMIMRELVQSIVDFFKRKYETEQIEAAASAESVSSNQLLLNIALPLLQKDVMRLVEVVSKTFTPSSWQANFGPSAAKTRHILQLKRADSCLEFEANELRGVDWKLYVGKL
ncbi:hypothetical protein DFJ73DRAFT_825547 [Zopfochytrium polystomum]|nr:hypothetical protein DFJ73DRAFT_825547 [Zopfochytrium polystomum]